MDESIKRADESNETKANATRVDYMQAVLSAALQVVYAVCCTSPDKLNAALVVTFIAVTVMDSSPTHPKKGGKKQPGNRQCKLAG